MFKVGDVVRHKASGERYVVVELGGDGSYCCDSGYDCTRWLRGVCLEAAPPLADSWVSRSATANSRSAMEAEFVKQDRDDKAWNLGKKDDTSDRGYYRG